MLFQANSLIALFQRSVAERLQSTSNHNNKPVSVKDVYPLPPGGGHYGLSIRWHTVLPEYHSSRIFTADLFWALWGGGGGGGGGASASPQYLDVNVWYGMVCEVVSSK